MSCRGSRTLLIVGVSSWLLSTLALADSTMASTPDDTSGGTNVAVVSDTSVATSPETAAVEILPPDDPWAGATRAEWEARSWQWWLSLPEEISPGLDRTGDRCGYGQFGPVFFLPGLVGGQVLDFNCVVAEGTALFVNPIGGACLSTQTPPPSGWNEDALRACASAGVEGVTETHARIDGGEVTDLEPYRIASSLFPAVVPGNGADSSPPTVSQAVSVSFSMIVAPPSRGEHEIEISTTFSDASVLVVTYTVTVEAPQVLEPSEAPAPSAAPTPSAAPGSEPAGAAAITIQDFAFAPADLSVAAGTTITITNNDTVVHTVTAEDRSFDTGFIEPGASTTLTLDTVGTFVYRCKPHPAMKGTITVT